MENPRSVDGTRNAKERLGTIRGAAASRGQARESKADPLRRCPYWFVDKFVRDVVRWNIATTSDLAWVSLDDPLTTPSGQLRQASLRHTQEGGQQVGQRPSYHGFWDRNETVDYIELSSECDVAHHILFLHQEYLYALLRGKACARTGPDERQLVSLRERR